MLRRRLMDCWVSGKVDQGDIMNTSFSLLGLVFAVLGWTYAFILVVVDRLIVDNPDGGSFDAVLEGFAWFVSPKLIAAQVFGVAVLYLFGANVFDWVLKGGV